jgi:hypothetical protein
MTSPVCEVKDGGGAYGATTNGVDVTPANTITIRLASQAGVDSWSISCVYTDETSDAATINAGLVVDATAKTATFTAPAGGKALIFQSRVNGGIDVNGRSQPSYTVTFGIFTLTGDGLRVLAINETLESDAAFGWIADVNALIRNVRTAPAPMAALAVDWDTADIHTKTLAAGANAITFANAGHTRWSIVVRLVSDAGGSTVTWPAGIKWGSGDTVPTQTATGVDVYSFVHDGTNIFGSVIQDFQ